MKFGGLSVNRGVVLATLLSLCQSSKDSSVCQPPTKTGPGPTKPSIASQYQVHVECNILDRKQTTTITESYDGVNNRGEITQTGSGTVFQGYFDYTTNEYLSVLPSSSICTVQDLSTSASNFIFGYQSGSSGQGRIFSASGALHFTAQGTTEVYAGKNVIRGIPVDTWYSCQYWQDMDATMNVTWYFSDNSAWDASLGSQTVPVAAHVTGRIYSGPRHRDFEHWYHFYQFTPSVQDSSFEIPDGIVCPHRKNVKPIPALSSSFMQIGEVISSYVTYLEEKYDKNQQIAAYQYKPNAEYDSEYGVNRMIEINDFNTGVAYIVDSLLGNCTVKRIDRGNFLYRRKSGSTHAVQMLSPSEYFLMDDMVDSYTYIGQRSMRGILCDVWTGVYKDVSLFGFNLTIEWYFMAKNWTTWNDVVALFPGDGVPVAMVNWAPDPASPTHKNKVIYEYNIFNFDRSAPNVLDYDISPCYINDNRRMFHVSIDGQYEGFISDNMEFFRYSFLSTVVSTCSISPLRVSNIKVDLDEDIHVTFEMLDVPPVAGDNVANARLVPLSEAATTFITAVQTSNFKLIWNVYTVSGFKAPNITVQSNSVREMDYETKQFGYTGAIGFGPGAMAGIAFAMVIIGGTMGAGLSFFCFK